MKGFAICVKDKEFVSWQGLLVDKLEYALVVQDAERLKPIAALFDGAEVVPVDAPDKNDVSHFRGTFFEWRIGL